MAVRLYLSRLIGDGLTPDTAFRPAWREVIGDNIRSTGQIIESERRNFWIGQLDTSDAEHAQLQADPRVRFVSQPLLATALADLTPPQRNAVLEVVTWLGLPTNIWNTTNARVADVLFYIVGRAAWHPIRQAEEAVASV